MITSDGDWAAQASRLFFSNIVEPLSDSFSAEGASIYNRLFAQVIECCRRKPKAAELDRELESFGLKTESEIAGRADRLNRNSSVLRFRVRSNIKRILIVSRVTLGADVAITSVIIDRLERAFPAAEIVLLGSGKLRELFAGDGRIRFKETSYGRTGSVSDRLMSWVELLNGVRVFNDEFDEGECVVVDPDSRFTQLGLLPLIADSSYLFFPTRTYKSGSSFSLAQLTSEWLDELLGDPQPTLPMLRLSEGDIERGSTVVRRLQNENRKPIVTVNFGVGDNNSKRVGDDFETQLISQLINDGFRVILDRGVGSEETRRADSVVRQLRRGNQPVDMRTIEAAEDVLMVLAAHSRLDCDLLMCSARIGLLAALIRASDLYIGYDSAGQHIAAAVDTPCIDLFADAVSDRFRQRWSPTGRVESRVIDASRKSSESVLNDAMLAARDLTKR